MIYNSVRGTDSTGAASVKRPLSKGEIEIVVAKELGHPFNLLQIKRKDEYDFSDVLYGQHRALLGHCRAKTIGDVSRYNAHPFAFDHVVGTHNGSLDYQGHKRLAGHDAFDTDSEAIFNEIETVGIAETAPKLSGAYALVWYDTRDNTLNFLRNKERTLYFAFNKDKTVLMWSSEFGHLFSAMSGATGQEIPHEDQFITLLPENLHYSWVIPEVNKAFEKAKAVTREGHKSPFTGQGYHTQGNQTNKHGNGTNSTSGTDTNYDKTKTRANCGEYGSVGLARISWQNATKDFWTRYQECNNEYWMSSYENGIYYRSTQDWWDSLSLFEKERRLRRDEYPGGIKTGYWYNFNTKQHEKISDSLDTKTLPVQVNPELTKPESFGVNNVLSIREQAKERRLRDVIHKDELLVFIYKTSDERVFWDPKNKVYVICTFEGFKPDEGWIRTESTKCPEYVPFKQLDINARHCFKHKGKGKKKVTYYRGFNKSMLVRETFEKIMEEGCLNCQRKPQWGNEVNFVSDKIFVCEHCSRDEETVKALREASKS